MREGYAVQILKMGEPILTIERNCVSGAHLSDDDIDAVRDGASHLASFAGPIEKRCFACGGVDDCEDNCPLQAGL